MNKPLDPKPSPSQAPSAAAPPRPGPSRLRTTTYSLIACLGCSVLFYWIGELRGGERSLAQFRDLSFQTTEASMQRLLRLDALLASGQVEEARRTMGSVAWSHYTSLEDDAGGVSLPASEKMKASIETIRAVVAKHCGAGAPLPAQPGAPDLCAELARRTK
jgi:hypothetical protein